MKAQSEKFPVRFLVELLNKRNYIVLTGKVLLVQSAHTCRQFHLMRCGKGCIYVLPAFIVTMNFVVAIILLHAMDCVHSLVL